MKELFFGTIIIFAAIFGCTLSPASDFVPVGGTKLPMNGYEKKFGKINVTVVNGIYKSSSSRLEQEFSIGHNAEQELPFNVMGATIDAKGKKFDGKILSTVFSENSKSPANSQGHLRIEWNFDEPGDKLLAQGFAITFNTKLDGKDENVTMQFEPAKK